MQLKPSYLKYENELKKIDLWIIVLNIIGILTVILLLFVPFFHVNPMQNIVNELVSSGVVTQAEIDAYDITTLNTELVDFFVAIGFDRADVVSWFETVSFSLYDEFKVCVESLLNGQPEILAVGFFTFITPLLGITAGLCLIGELFNTVIGMNHKDYAIKFARIKSNGEDKVKMTSYTHNLFVSFFIMVFVNVFYVKFLAKSFSKKTSMPSIRMNYITGVSPLIVMPIMAIVTFYIIFGIKARAEKYLAYKIISDEEKEHDKQKADKEEN